MNNLAPKKWINRRDFLTLAGLGVVAAACTPIAEKIKSIQTMMDGTPTQRLPSETQASTLQPTPSETPTPSKTPEPSTTPTPAIPERFDEPGLQEKIINEFMSKPEMQDKLQKIKSGNYDSKKSDFQLVIESYTDDPNYRGGFGVGGIGEHTVYVAEGSMLVSIGAEDISAGFIPGWRRRDKIKTMYFCSPEESDVLCPVVIGMQKDYYWHIINRPYKHNSAEKKNIDNSDQGFSSWCKSTSGKLMRVGFILYFEKEGVWNTDRFWQIEDSIVREIINTPGNYLQRFTKNPSLLGSGLRRPNGLIDYVFSSRKSLISQLDQPADSGGLISNEWSFQE